MRPSPFKLTKPLLVFFAVLGLCLLTVYLAYTRGGAARHLNPDALKYYRSVFVLQSIDNLATLEKEEIPERIRFHDSTESLLHQTDQGTQLREVAQSLQEVRELYPKAQLFEAYARRLLGEKKQVIQLLSDYVAANPYEGRYYALLAKMLREEEDYTSLYLICQEWAEQAATCRKDCVEHTWAALFSLKKYTQAFDFISQNASCLGWEKEVLLAKTLLALEQEEKSKQVLEQAFINFPEDQLSIELRWQQIKDKDLL